ncbi:MAG: sigma-54-dependent Fis family transcriptional regulator [Nitrospinae bacterium]|nr:sigma-54-dependent Fis family transcriptional regulator [Nitrospinota bacterium]
MNKEKILVVDDEESIRWIFKKGLEGKGFHVHTVENGEEALKKVRDNSYLVIFLDIYIPNGMSGLEVLTRIREIDKETAVVMITAQSTMSNTIEAIQKGAYDYITKPFDINEIFIVVDKILKTRQLERKVELLEAELKDRFKVGDIIGRSKAMQEVYKTIGRVASSDLTVLIQGESGTGKELVARALHYNNSKRVVGPFVAVNCAAIPKELLESELFGHEKGSFTGAIEERKGKFELAEKGTIFLDEIGDMDITLQAKILRVLQDKEYSRVGGKGILKSDARIIVATNRDLKMAIKEKRFREDLFHRLNVITITLPPIRERRMDIPLLARYMLQKYNSEFGNRVRYIAKEVMDIFKTYQWDGNVRELENTVKRAIALCPGDTIMPEHLPENMVSEKIGVKDNESQLIKDFLYNKISPFLPIIKKECKGRLYESVLKDIEKELVTLILEETGGNQIKASRYLGINRNTLNRKIKEYHIKINGKRSAKSLMSNV